MPRRSLRPSRRVPEAQAGCRFPLLVIDNRPLQRIAWQELILARKRLERSARELHRHEEKDEPAFRTWLGTTFPALVSETRELLLEIEAKRQLVEKIEMESFATGRSPHEVWRAWQKGERTEDDDDDFADLFADEAEGSRADDFWDDSREETRRGRDRGPFDDGSDRPGETSARERKRAFDRERIIDGLRRTEAPGMEDARELYRRLVLRLHPDCGGEWTPTRERVWHQVQQAWAARDRDWLARLEAEWDAATDVLHPGSPISRLRAARREIDTARRDAERKVRDYRKTDAWRFTLKRQTEAFKTRLKGSISRDCFRLRATLREVQAILDAWQRPRRRRSSRPWRTATSQSFY